MNVLVLCTGNSARSILLECLLGQTVTNAITAFSAGSQPTGLVNPRARDLLLREGYDVSGLRSKSWDEFLTPDAQRMDLVITVCGAADQICPAFPGRAQRAHWGLDDPAAVQGDPAAMDAAFETAYQVLRRRADAFLGLDPTSRRDPAVLDAIGAI